MAKKHFLPKINSIGYGGNWIGLSLLVGFIIPGVVWMIAHIYLWVLSEIGGISLGAFIIVFAIEMHQDNSKIPYFERGLSEKIPFDSTKQYAVLKSSICTGGKMAGFKDKSNGHFTEVMLIRTDEELERFKKLYGISEIKKEY